MLVCIDHVQLAAPPGAEDALRAYCTDVLGMTEIPKPPVLAARGGVWFLGAPPTPKAVGEGTVQLHLGIEAAPAGGGECHFRPAKKAHPGLRVTRIEAYAARLEERGAMVVWDDNLHGHRRFYSEDPVGNRPEFLEPTGTGAL
ncbi:glyoxalase [Streptomyces sp. NBC_01481]|uniref:glyoxalase n=1 Tax=Streptomyces sp. NBC_01481 TaxID=2975869 RepID=UPI0022549E78|nr:glyoxalase [Streptomyces sp. NBC_01481]MCX4581633.1 glyoxalase [Streptomyces sp. NBC_01481]